jgi:FkbM family methyltransferase
MLHSTLHMACKIPGVRRFLWRAGRAAYTAARGDLPNDPRSNGEYWLLRNVIATTRPGDLLLDVGANVGDWSMEALRLGAEQRGCAIVAFEPASSTNAVLRRRLGDRISIHQAALSDHDGEAAFLEAGDCAGTNSLAPAGIAPSDTVRVCKLDSLLRERSNGAAKMVKVDCEGFDLIVMRGARDALSAGAIECLQFEYNWRWLQNGLSLRDAFLLARDYTYRIGKLMGSRMEFYSEWHPELDRFFEANFVLVRRGSPLERLGTSVSFDQTNSITRSDAG